MELKSSVTTFFLLFLLFANPFLSRGESPVESGPDLYEIDYRGPETHSSIPPPDHSRGKPMNHRERESAPVKCIGSRGCNTGGNGKKSHG